MEVRLVASGLGYHSDTLLLAAPSFTTFASLGGTISSHAGNGVLATMGDGGPPLSASIGNPKGVATAPNGDVYWIEAAIGIIRKYDSAGDTVTTFAGQGNLNFSGDSGPAGNAELYSTTDLAIRNDSLFLVDNVNSRIRAIDLATTVINTIAGNGFSSTNGDSLPALQTALTPDELAFGPDGALYYTDDGNHLIRKLDFTTGQIITVAGTGQNVVSGDGGLATAAGVGDPFGIAVSASGDIYFSGNHRIRKIDGQTGIVSTVVGTGVQGYAGPSGTTSAMQFGHAGSLSFDPIGDLWVSDGLNDVIWRIDFETDSMFQEAGVFQASAFSGDGGPAQIAELNIPNGLEVDSIGGIWFSDNGNNRIRKISGPSWQLTGTPTCADIGPHPVTIAVTDGVDTVYQSFTIHVVDSTPPQITCPNDIVETSSTTFCGAQVSWIPPAGADDCSIATTLQTDSTGLTPGNFFPVGTTEIEYTTTDTSGNAQTCAFTITVVDSTPPELTCPSDTTVHVTNGNCEAAVTFTPPNGSDLCSTPTTVQTDATGLTSGDNFPLGTTQLEYTATDTSGNAQTCQLNITVIDTIPPTITCPDSIATGNPVVNFSDPAVTDNCFGSTLTQTDGSGLSSGSSFPFGLTVLVYTATDQAGNTTICALPILVDTTISVPELSDAGSLSVFPNPNAGSFTVALPQTTGTLTLMIYNTLGEQVLSQHINAAGSIAQVQLPRTAKGIYFLRLRSSTEQWQERIAVR